MRLRERSLNRRYVSQQRTAFKPIIPLMPNGIKRDICLIELGHFCQFGQSWQSPPMSDAGGPQSLDHLYYIGHKVHLLPLARQFGTDQHKMLQSALLSLVVLLFGEGASRGHIRYEAKLEGQVVVLHSQVFHGVVQGGSVLDIRSIRRQCES